MTTTQRTLRAISTLMLSALWLTPGCGGGEPVEETLAGWDAADGEDVSLTGTLVVNMTRHHDGDAHEAHPCEPEYLLYRSLEDITPVRLAFDDAPPSAVTGDELTVRGTLQGRGRIRTVLVDSKSSPWPVGRAGWDRIIARARGGCGGGSATRAPAATQGSTTPAGVRGERVSASQESVAGGGLAAALAAARAALTIPSVSVS